MASTNVLLVCTQWSAREIREQGVSVPGDYWPQILKAVEANDGGGDSGTDYFTPREAGRFAEALRAAVGAERPPKPVSAVSKLLDDCRVVHGKPRYPECGIFPVVQKRAPALRPGENGPLLASVLAVFEGGHAVSVVRRPV